MATQRPGDDECQDNPEKNRREKELILLVREKARPYLNTPNVTSVGVGYKIKNGNETDVLSIQFTVARKLSLEQLCQMGLKPLPDFFIAKDGTVVPTDVVERSYGPEHQVIDAPATARPEAGRSTTSQQRRTRRDPIRPGISVSHVDLGFGTIGAIVYDALNGTPYILSNWHVLRGPTGQLNDQTVQPSAHDDGNVISNIVGRLIRSHLGEDGDCAIASIVGRGFDPSVLGRDIVPRRVGEASIGDRVVKSGRKTGVTFGVVNRVGVFTNMDYGPGFNNVQIGGFEIRPNPDKPAQFGEISESGDSGSVWMVDADGANRDIVLGLHFAGELDPNPALEHALACNFQQILDALQISLVNPLT
ncbi:MAG: hypothetical protein ACREEM_22090 [Blastocatellia bacterium]